MSWKTWLKQHKWLALVIGGVLLLALGAGALLVVAVQPSPTPQPSPVPTASVSPSPSPSPTSSPTPRPTPVAIRCPLNGLAVSDPASLKLPALAVQIENDPLARPARNLGTADLVIEATVEGDVTRFTALFWCRATEGLTGPVRSARYYNVDLWQDLHVLTIGFGASDGALDRFAAAGMPYVNGITGAWPWFARYGTYPAPHNLYADLEALRGTFGEDGALDQVATGVGDLRPPFTFDEHVALPSGRRIAGLEVLTNPYWRIGWRWDSALAGWRRLDGGVEISDAATNLPLVATHVVVQRVTEDVVYGDPDPGGNPRRYQHLVGFGKGTLYTGGQAIELNWSRETAGDPTTWTYAESGDPVVLSPGVIWWEIVPSDAGLTEF